jgi:transposase-like protein
MKCFNPVGENCSCCQSMPIKYGKSGSVQRYYCKNCKKTWLAGYAKRAFLPSAGPNIIALLKEGCGIRSIARLLNISATTVISRIQKIAGSIKKPAISMERTYEVDELKTYINNKNKECPSRALVWRRPIEVGRSCAGETCLVYAHCCLPLSSDSFQLH